MKENKIKRNPPRLQKTESGSGGISYAMYFIAIVITAFLYSFTTFSASLYVIEEVLENGLHIVENVVLTSNQASITETGREDTFDRELQRMKIVTKSTYQNTWGVNEQEQVNNLGEKFQDALVSQLGLVSNIHPSSGILAKMCGTDANIAIVGDVIIYEPIYDLQVIRTSNADAIIETDEHYVTKSWDFTTDYTIVGWVEYDLHYTNNVYQGCSKKLCSQTPILTNGKQAEGATIEATLGVSFAGLKNIFAGISTTTPTIGTDGEIDMSGVENGMFSNNPEQLTYQVQVTQAMDIVIADKDSRKIGN